MNKNISCLHAVELDERLKPELEELRGELKENNLKLHWGDALKINYELLEPFPEKVISNIPYNITTPLIWKLLEFASNGLKYHLYMVQKEAAERLTGKPKTKSRYPLGITIEAMGRAKIIKNVSRECFRPVPKVDSCVIEIIINKNFNLGREILWNELLHKAFSQRRKTLINNLSGFKNISREEWNEIFLKLNLENLMTSRAEELDSDTWLKIYEKIKNRCL